MEFAHAHRLIRKPTTLNPMAFDGDTRSKGVSSMTAAVEMLVDIFVVSHSAQDRVDLADALT